MSNQGLRLPAELAPLIEAELPAIAGEVLRAIADEVPEYARPLDGSFGRNLQLGVGEGLRRFAATLAEPDADRPADVSHLYSQLGAGELRAGRSLDALQSAYRVGARTAWRRLSALGLQAGVDAAALCTLAEAVFAYIDEISAESVEGYAQAQSAEAGERDRRRRRVARLLIQDPPPGRLDIRDAAHAAGWRLPASAAVIACAVADSHAIVRKLPPDVIAVGVEEQSALIFGDPDGPGRRGELERATDGFAVALGPTAELTDLRRSWERARSALRLIPEGERPGLLRADEHLVEILLYENAALLRELADRWLTPLDGDERLAETLLAVLREGSAPAAAAALGVHAQTVRYRMAQIKELLPENALEDSEARFQLELALRATGGAI